MASTDKAAFRSAHKEEIDRYEDARSNLQRSFPDNTFPDMMALKTQKDRLQHLMNHQNEVVQSVRKTKKDLDVVRSNISSMQIIINQAMPSL